MKKEKQPKELNYQSEKHQNSQRKRKLQIPRNIRSEYYLTPTPTKKREFKLKRP